MIKVYLDGAKVTVGCVSEHDFSLSYSIGGFPDPISLCSQSFSFQSCFSTWPKTSGIYCLYNIKNSKSIIGLSKRSFRERWSNYRSELRGDRYGNLPLQRSYNKYGEDSFIFFVIEEVDPLNESKLKETESYWIDKFKTRIEFNGFNLKDGGDLPIFSEETKKRMSKACYARYGREYRFKNPDGIIIEIKDLKEFCIKNNLSEKMMSSLFSGNETSYKGYTQFNSDYIPLKKRLYVFISPSGEEFTVNNIKLFCEKMNLSRSSLQMVANGKNRQYLGWKLKTPIPGTKSATKKKENIKYSLRCPDGKVICIDNLYKFAKDNNLNYKGLHGVLNKNFPSYKGYTHPETSPVLRCLRKTVFVSPAGEEVEVVGSIVPFCKKYGLDDGCVNMVQNKKLKSHKKWTLKE